MPPTMQLSYRLHAVIPILPFVPLGQTLIAGIQHASDGLVTRPETATVNGQARMTQVTVLQFDLVGCSCRRIRIMLFSHVGGMPVMNQRVLSFRATPRIASVRVTMGALFATFPLHRPIRLPLATRSIYVSLLLLTTGLKRLSKP